MKVQRSVLPHAGVPAPQTWRSQLRQRFPQAISLIDRIGDPVVEWAKRCLPDEAFVRLQFKDHVGFLPDLANPKTFAEKLQWLKLHDVTPLHRLCSDKLKVREHVARTVGGDVLIPLIAVLDDARELTPERIDAAGFAAKANHDCGSVVLCFDRGRFDWPDARKRLRRHLRTGYWRKQRERAYQGIVPKIIVEELLRPAAGGTPDDLKFFCFAGKVELVQIITGRFTDKTISMLSRDWTLLPISCVGIPCAAAVPPKPERLEEMIAMAQALAAPFRFCRVDFYELHGKVRFGEYCFYPDGGYRPLEPVEWEWRLGALIKI